MKVEYKVRPVTRYVVTEYQEYGNGSNSSLMGEFDNYRVANKICHSIARDSKNYPSDMSPEVGELQVFYTLYSPEYQLEDIKVEIV